MRRLILAATAAALLVAPAQASATFGDLKVTKQAGADTTTPHSFTLARKGRVVQTFTLKGGESRTLRLEDTEPARTDRYVVTEQVAQGWRLVSITCSTNDRDPKDAEIIEAPSVLVEMSPNEKKACVFTNELLPPPMPPTPPTPPAPVVAPVVVERIVEVERVVERPTVVVKPVIVYRDRRVRCEHRYSERLDRIVVVKGTCGKPKVRRVPERRQPPTPRKRPGDTVNPEGLTG